MPKVNGSADYGIDAMPEGLLYASIERCPTLQGKVKGYDKKAALSVKGVKHVMEVTRTVYKNTNTGIAVVAENYHAALEGRKRLNVQWDNEAFKKVSSDLLFEEKEKLAREGNLLNHKNQGDFDANFEAAADNLDVIYEQAHQSHSCMEPMNATVHIREDNTAEVWAPSQSPQVQRNFAQKLGIPENQAEEKIKVHLPFLGGGFGRRSMNDPLEECFQISEALRKPVKLIWTREDDNHARPFSPGNCSCNEGGL